MSAAVTPVEVELEEAHDLPIADVFVVTHTGTMLDPPGREGSLNLALRSARRGTASRSAREIDLEIDRMGAELSTSSDPTSTTLHVSVLRRNLAPMLELLREIVTEPRFPPHDVAQVQREIKADLIDARDDDRGLAGRHFRRALFAGHAFGRPSAGTPETLSRVRVDDAVETWRRTMRRGNVIVAAAGDVRPDELSRFAEGVRAGLNPGASPSREVDEPKRLKGRHLLIVDKPGRTQTQIYIGNVASHARDRDHAAMVLGNTVFGGTFSARLMREVRSKRGWSYVASSRLGRDRAREAWWMWSFPGAADAPACVALQLRMVRDLVQRGVRPRELDLAKSFLRRGRAFELDTPTRRLSQRIEERVLGLPRGWYDRLNERLDAVTVDDVNAALQRRLSAEDLLVTVVATASELRAPLEKVGGFDSVRVVPFDAD
ncbi:MAG: pitrilysin family protein [Polyangiales bacterium]